MNRSVSREKGLDSFSIDIDILSNLFDKLLELFDKKESSSASIKFKLRKEELDFDSVEEIRQYAEQNKSFPKRINKYRLRVHGHSPFGNGGLSSIYIYSDLERGMCIEATSDNEAWCTGAIEAITSFLRPYRVWYYFLFRINVLWVGGICFLSFLIFNFLDFLKLLESVIGTMIGTIIAYLFLLLLIIFLILPVLKIVIPHSEIIISKQEGFLRRRHIEILIFIGVGGLVFEIARFLASKLF